MNENVEIAFEGILKGRHFEELCHKLFGIRSSPKIDSELEAVDVDLVADVDDLLELALGRIGLYLLDNCLDRGSIRDLMNVNAVSGLIVAVTCAD